VLYFLCVWCSNMHALNIIATVTNAGESIGAESEPAGVVNQLNGRPVGDCPAVTAVFGQTMQAAGVMGLWNEQPASPDRD
jgi:hypothetical protein